MLDDSVVRVRTDAPALTPEAREQQVAAKAVELIEKKIEEGTASPQLLLHYAKKASPMEAKETEYLKKKIELLEAKIDAIKSAVTIKDLLEEAKASFSKYSGQED